MLKNQNIISSIKGIILSISTLTLVACGIDAPKSEIAYAEATIQSARNVDASRYAGVELEKAKGKLLQAKAAVKTGNNEAALRLANESTAVANLAQAKAEAGKAKVAEMQMQDSLNMLKSQLK